MAKPASSYLSKSLFIRGRQCHKSLWLQKNRPELKDEITNSQQSIFQSGTDVGILAQQLFPGGVEIPYDGLSHKEQIEMTRTQITQGRETIYEATFLFDGIFVKVDILHHGLCGWEIYEVKGSTEVKEVHSFDAGVQYHVLTGEGLEVSKVAIVNINNQYVRLGNLEIQQLFTIEDITGTAQELQPIIVEEIKAQREMLKGDMPNIDIGRQCDDPYPCDFAGHCWQHIPEDSVFDLRGRGADKFALYREGIIRQENIPLDRLNSSQRFQVESTLQKRDHIDKQAVKAFLDDLWYPLCFLDFETFMTAVPPFDGCRPYQKIPFQYSLHIQESAGAELKHYEYLVEPGKDPRLEILDSLLTLIPAGACIVAWSQSFEIGVLRQLAEYFTGTQAKVDRLIEGFRDLMVPFRNRDIYPWQAKGSYSIKPILPLLAPELSYENLAGVANGGDAMEAYHSMNEASDPAEVARIRAELLEYCKLDTLAMVRILERIKEVAVL